MSFNVQNLNPRQVLYLKVEVGNRDGTIELDGEMMWGNPDLQAVIASAVEYSDEHHGESYIYEMRPIRYIGPGKTVVKRIKVKE